MLVVLAQHDTGHGEVGSVVYLGQDSVEGLMTAVDVARTVESFGYQFYGFETGVSIIRITPGETICRRDQTLVYFRRHTGHGWMEEWFDPSAQKKFEANKQAWSL